MANTTPIVTTVTKIATKEKTPNGAVTASRINILNFCEEHYEDILSVIRRDKRREVHTWLDFGENSKKSRRMREDSQNSSAKTLSTRYHNPSKRPQVRDQLRNNDGNVFGRLGHRRKSAFKRLSDTYSPNTNKSGPDREYSRNDSCSRGRPHKRNSSPKRDHPQSRGRSHVIEESYGNTYSSYRTGEKLRYHSHGTGRSSSMKKGRNSKSLLSRVDPFTPRIRNFKRSWKTRMPNNVKTYDETGGLEDHVKKFQAAGRTLGNAYVVSHVQLYPHRDCEGMQKKYIKDPVEIHNIKQKDGETIKEFMKRFKIETERMKGAPECMRIFRFMHGVNNPKLIKRLNEHVPKTLEKMMTAIVAFIRGKTDANSMDEWLTLRDEWPKVNWKHII
nr:hypothetical protein [Tanacetum cinerariifolium]